MPYYQGQGDFWGAIKGAVGGFITGGPIGAVTGGVAGALAKKTAPAPAPVLMAGPPLPRPDSVVTRSVGGSATAVGPWGLGTGNFTSQQQTSYYSGPQTMTQSGPSHPGYHLDKKTRSRLVKNRSMNPANPRALRRAIRREKRFIQLAKSALRGTGITIGRHGVARKKGRK